MGRHRGTFLRPTFVNQEMRILSHRLLQHHATCIVRGQVLKGSKSLDVQVDGFEMHTQTLCKS